MSATVSWDAAMHRLKLVSSSAIYSKELGEISAAIEKVNRVTPSPDCIC